MIETCREKIREDENFITYKIYFSSYDLPRILKENGISKVYKGDQNILWDGLITDIALKIFLKDEILFYPFIHDEKLGTGDQRLISLYKDNQRFTITEDYAQKITGAVYINQDVSYGLFYAVPIEPKEYKDLNFCLSWLADRWKEYREILDKDENFKRALESLGFSWNYERISEITHQGPCANKDILKEYFKKYPSSEIYYLFSKSLGWYGIVPRYSEEISLSSIYIDDSNMLDLIKKLFYLSVRGCLRQVKNKDKRKEILKRARKIKIWFEELLKKQKTISLVDIQKYIAKKIIEDVYSNFLNLEFTTTSQMLKILSNNIDEENYYFFDLCLKYPKIFVDSYNMALNKSKLHLKRLSIKNDLFYPPFFIEVFSKDELKRNILTRCSIEIKNGEKETYIRLFSPHCASNTFILNQTLDNAQKFIKVLIASNNFPYGFALIGKAGPFMAEMRKPPKILAVPESGSKYSPMVDYFLGELKKRNINVPQSFLLRIRLNTLDNLNSLKDYIFRLPKFLSIYLGEEINGRELANSWREKVSILENILRIFPHTEQGEYFHLATILLIEKGYMPKTLYEKEKIQKYFGKIKNSISFLLKIDFPKILLEVLKNLIEERSRILSELNLKKEKAEDELHKKRDFIEYKILFIFGVIIRSLLLVKESLKYLNYRPYTLSIYLIGGEDFFKYLVDNVKFNLEKIEFKT
ncbi:MAG: hypothetical protein NZ841_05085 [Dictyoglomus sp.]|nr:hypothetical protein [Dictyoglomus sp.]MCX7942189.1 hypothetical protein [Dictyoglomaceae bacterium]MDW8188652.1 hypothetical protein [Dictyoglomus sp.]